MKANHITFAALEKRARIENAIAVGSWIGAMACLLFPFFL